MRLCSDVLFDKDEGRSAASPDIERRALWLGGTGPRSVEKKHWSVTVRFIVFALRKVAVFIPAPSPHL